MCPEPKDSQAEDIPKSGVDAVMHQAIEDGSPLPSLQLPRPRRATQGHAR